MTWSSGSWERDWLSAPGCAAAFWRPVEEERAKYLEKARKLARRWKKHLKLRDDHYIWHYWDPAGRWDYGQGGDLNHWIGLEHRSYGAADTGFMAAACSSVFWLSIPPGQATEATRTVKRYSCLTPSGPTA